MGLDRGAQNSPGRHAGGASIAPTQKRELDLDLAPKSVCYWKRQIEAQKHIQGMKTAKAKSADCSHIQKILVKSKTWGGHLYSNQRVEATLLELKRKIPGKQAINRDSCSGRMEHGKNEKNIKPFDLNRVWRSAISGLMAGSRALEKEKLPSVRENMLRLEKEKASSEKQADL